MEHAKRPPKKEEMKKRFQIFKPSFSMLIFQGVKNNVMVGWFAPFFDFSLNFCPLTEGTKTALRPSFFSSWVLIMFLKPQHLCNSCQEGTCPLIFWMALLGISSEILKWYDMISNIMKWHDIKWYNSDMRCDIKHVEKTRHEMQHEMIRNDTKHYDVIIS